ncbi:MAG: site-specific integrase [Lachnospiraceae bacterium]|nr:site-specific integrase [Lachnospiraceae bacterium]
MGRPGENIHKRKDGRWEARVVIGTPVDGKTKYKSFYSRNYQDVRTKKKEFLLTLNGLSTPAVGTMQAGIGTACVTAPDTMSASSLPAAPLSPEAYAQAALQSTMQSLSESPDQAIPFSDVARQWLTYKKLSLKESSYAFYSIMIEKHLLPNFGEVAVSDIESEQINTFLSTQKASGHAKNGGPLADKTLSEIKSILIRILRHAKSLHYISEVPDSAPVAVKKKATSVFTEQEMILIENKAREEDTAFAVGILLTAYSGIRIGELCALKWEDFDWANGTFHISKTISRINDVDGESDAKTHLVIGSPKTDCSNRTIPIPESVQKYFKDHAGDPSHYVLTGKDKFMEPRVYRARYARFLKRAGVKHHTFHTLRHTYATNCVEQGVNVKALSEILGHSDVSITLARYVHPSMELKKAQVNKLKTFANR